MAKTEQVRLDTLARGAAMERFEAELERVIDNIGDPNTGEGKREITLKITFKPTRDRGTVNVSVSCTTKLASMEPYPTLIYISKGRDGQPAAYENDPRQGELFEDAPAENIEKFNRKAEGE